MSSRNNTAVIIRGIFNAKAQGIYFGEDVTQRQHAEQTYQLAKDDGADVEIRIAAFLHDIGHMISPISAEFGNINHDKIGADWLRKMGFSERVASISEEHVNAKRYLCKKKTEVFR
jgi:2-amino-1-hydroxyethylphosphonate dioxygenase (glycine-forming)